MPGQVFSWGNIAAKQITWTGCKVQQREREGGPPGSRGKVMSQGTNKLQRPFLANSIYSRNPISKMSINSCENQINSCRH